MRYSYGRESLGGEKIPVTVLDRLLEVIAAVVAVAMLVLTGVLYAKAPETVPCHFNYAGEVDGWAGKGIYWFLAISMLIGMLVCACAAYNHKLINLPIRLKSAVIERQRLLLSRMCRILTICFGLMWFAILLAFSVPFVELTHETAMLCVYTGVFLMLGIILFYVLRIWWVGRGE